MNGLSKHIDIKYHFVRELVDKKQIEVVFYMDAKNMLADIMTKGSLAIDIVPTN
jgi:riboflavin synthase alpha subunit